MVPVPTPVMNLLSNRASSLVPTHSHGRIVNEDVVLPSEPFEPTPRMDKGKQPANESFQRKRKWVVSVDSREEEFFRITPGADLTGRLADVMDTCRQLLLFLRLHLPVQWLNEFLYNG